MPGTTPEATFREAQQAMAAGDLEAVFACFHPDDLRLIGKNALALLIGADLAPTPALRAVCDRFGAGAGLEALTGALRAIQASARRAVARDPAYDPAAHQALVKASDAALTAVLSSASDGPAFVAALERTRRADGGGGSISTSLFLGETLEEVEVRGRKAYATRRHPGGSTDDLGFAKSGSVWLLRLGARRPRSKGG